MRSSFISQALVSVVAPVALAGLLIGCGSATFKNPELPRIKDQKSLPVYQIQTESTNFAGTAFPSEKISRLRVLYRDGIPLLMQKAFDAKTVPVKLIATKDEPKTGLYLTASLVKMDSPSRTIATVGKVADKAQSFVPGLSQVTGLLGAPKAQAQIRVQIIDAANKSSVVDETFEASGLPDSTSLGSIADAEDDRQLTENAGTGCLYEAMEEFAQKLAKSLK